jgi:hypothetical protein
VSFPVPCCPAPFHPCAFLPSFLPFFPPSCRPLVRLSLARPLFFPLFPPTPPHPQNQNQTPTKNQAAAKAAKQGRGALVLGVGVREFKEWLQGKLLHGGPVTQGEGEASASVLVRAPLSFSLSLFLYLYVCIYIYRSYTPNHPTITFLLPSLPTHNNTPTPPLQARLLDPLAPPSGLDDDGQHPQGAGATALAAPAFCRALVERLGSGGQLRKPKIAKVSSHV